jgi:hypothetical protein
MGFSLGDFARLRPYLFHLTAQANIDRIRRMRRLDSASRILLDAGRPGIVRSKRRRHEVVQIGDDLVYVRDQAPLHQGNTELSDGWSFEDFVQHLNEMVFFWPGTEGGPIPYGVRHYERYQGEAPVIIRVSTTSVLQANVDTPPLFCRFNSGSPRCTNGRPSPRSPLTFRPAGQLDVSAGRVVEVVFNATVVLPPDAQVGAAPSGPWAPLW